MEKTSLEFKADIIKFDNHVFNRLDIETISYTKFVHTKTSPNFAKLMYGYTVGLKSGMILSSESFLTKEECDIDCQSTMESAGFFKP